jgi:hypothetical protein
MTFQHVLDLRASCEYVRDVSAVNLWAISASRRGGWVNDEPLF